MSLLKNITKQQNIYTVRTIRKQEKLTCPYWKILKMSHQPRHQQRALYIWYPVVLRSFKFHHFDFDRQI